MDKKEMQYIIESLNLNEVIELECIPNLDLYMDQIITLFNSKLSHMKRYEEDKLLTKTMINNYTKDKVLMPAKKKKYTKAHVILMILVYDLKQILTITDIKAVFSSILEEDSINRPQMLEEIYNAYLEIKLEQADLFKEEVEALSEPIEKIVNTISIEDAQLSAEKLKNILEAMVLTQKANYYKRLAEKIIDEKIINDK